MPNFSCGAILRDLLEEIIMGIEKEAQPRAEFVNLKAASACPFDVLDSVIKREGQFLQGRRSCFANVISADRNGVESGRELRAEFECIHYQPHRWRGRIDVLLLRDVFLQDIVLNCAGNLFPVSALLL